MKRNADIGLSTNPSNLIDHPFLGDNDIDMFVVGFHGHLGDQLSLEHQAHLAGGHGQVGDDPVVVPVTGSDPPTFFIHGDSGNDGDID